MKQKKNLPKWKGFFQIGTCNSVQFHLQRFLVLLPLIYIGHK